MRTLDTMTRRDAFAIAEQILELLKTEQELSINQISRRLRLQWDTTMRAINFLKRVRLIVERPGPKGWKTTRLFSLAH